MKAVITHGNQAIDLLRAHLTQQLGDTATGLLEVLSRFQAQKLGRNQPLLHAGQVCQHVYFIAQGALQVYAEDASHNEVTRDILCEGQWCSSLVSFGQQVPATESIRSVEDTWVLRLHRADFTHCMHTQPLFVQTYQTILQTSYAQAVERLQSLLALPAKQRIDWLQTNQPAWVERFSDRLLASFLGMAPETFSRLKSQRP